MLVHLFPHPLQIDLEINILTFKNKKTNLRLLGARLKGDQKAVTTHLKTKVTEEELEKLLDEGKITVLGSSI